MKNTKNNSAVLDLILSTRLVFPSLTKTAGKSGSVARQLDVTLMSNGFKLSDELLSFISKSSFEDSIRFSQTILDSVKKLVGSHVKHTTYFIQFPKNVPDTLDFWWTAIVSHFVGQPIYGQHLHTYEDMLAYHKTLNVSKSTKFKIVNLGASLESEVALSFVSIANSTVPLNEKTRKDIGILLDYDATLVSLAHPTIRENKAIINAIKLKNGIEIEVDTVVDVLRLAAELSGGDVTLATNTKFKNFPSSVRKGLVDAIDKVAVNNFKIEDGLRFREQFKRLARQIHPRKTGGKNAIKFFDVIGGSKKIKTTGATIHENLVLGIYSNDFSDYITSLKNKTGQLARNIDVVLRNGDKESLDLLVKTFGDGISGVSGRNLLSIYQHIQNRLEGNNKTRIFVNRGGKGYVMPDTREDIKSTASKKILKLIEKEIYDRVPVVENLVIDPSVEGVAVPLSEKSKSDGLGVLPRGSIINIGEIKGDASLRFFIYWKEKSSRTDYDLSGAFYGEGMTFINQISWTHLRSGDGTILHSGDFTSAPNGASEFIDIKLDKIDPRIKYIIPTINKFAGETFKECEECFFGFMERPSGGRGLPYEPTTVKTKFNVRGEGGVGYPLIFVKENGVWYAKWIDLYAAGRSYCNTVEQNKFSTMTVAKGVVDNKYLTMGTLLDFYQSKSVKNKDKGNTVVSAVSVEKTDEIEKIIGINELKDLIPA